MSTLIHQRVAAARAGKNPTVICSVPSGWVVLGDVQFFRGYALLLADPVVPSLNTLTGKDRSQFLRDMAIAGDALLAVTGADRINYEILGNTEPALHAHLFPRYRTEPAELYKQPVWAYSAAQRRSIEFDRDRDQALMIALAAEIQRRLAIAMSG